MISVNYSLFYSAKNVKPTTECLINGYAGMRLCIHTHIQYAKIIWIYVLDMSYKGRNHEDNRHNQLLFYMKGKP